MSDKAAAEPFEWTVRRCRVHELIDGEDLVTCPGPGPGGIGRCGMPLSEPFRVRRVSDAEGIDPA